MKPWNLSLPSLRDLLRAGKKLPGRGTRDGRPALPLALEALEDRTLLNRAPVLSLPATTVLVVKTALLTVQATATDPDGDVLTFSLVGAPPGATIHPGTGLLTWTPTEDQGPALFTFTVQVTDNGHPQRSDQKTLTVTTLAAGLVNNDLLIVGTSGNDTAFIQAADHPNQILVTVNGSTTGPFTVPAGGQIITRLFAGNDRFAGTFAGNFAGKLTLAGVENATMQVGGNFDGTLTVDAPGLLQQLSVGGMVTAPSTITATHISNVSIGTLAGRLTAAGGSIIDATVTHVASTGLLEATEIPSGPNAGLLKNSSFGTISGRVLAGSIVGMKVGNVALGAAVRAAGQGTTTNVSIGTLAGSFTAPEDENPGSGVMSATTIGTITSTGTVSTGSISGMSVGVDAGFIIAAGQGTTTNLSIGTLSGAVLVPEDENPGSGVMSATTIGTITSTGTVSTGAISGMSVGVDAGSITAAGQGTTTNLSIGTLSGAVLVPEDENPDSGVMSNTSIGTITSTGTVSTGAISGMSVGTAEGSITAAGHGTIINLNIVKLSGSVTAKKDENPGSGLISNSSIGTLSSTGKLSAGGEVKKLTIVTVQGGNLSAGRFQTLAVPQVTADEVKLVEAGVTRSLKVTAVPGFSRPASFGFSYDGTGSGNPQVTVQVPGAPSNVRYDLSVTTDTVNKPRSGIDLAGLTADAATGIRNVVVGGNLTGMVRLPLDSVAVAVAGNIPARSLVVRSAPAVAFGFANGVSAANAKTTDVTGLFAAGTPTVQANDTFGVFVGDGVPVALFLVTAANGNNFDAKNLLFTDQGADFRPVTAAVRVAAGSASTVRQIDLTGEAASFQTQQRVSEAINVLSGSLGDVTLKAPGGSPANITTPRVVGNIDVTNGAISGIIRTTVGDFGRAFANAAGQITGVTFIRAGGGGLTSTGKIISAANLVSLVDLQSSLDGVIAAGGDIGVIQTDASGNAVVGPAPARALTRFGGINVSTGGVKGSIVALGNVFGDINLSGGLDGRIAVKGRTVAGLPTSRTGILGNVNITGGISQTGAIVSAGVIGDDGSNNIDNDSVGTKLNISGAAKGILAALGDINFGATGSLNQAHVFENVASPPSNPNKAAIDAIFTNGGVALTIPDGLALILADLAALRVGPDGKLTGTTP